MWLTVVPFVPPFGAAWTEEDQHVRELDDLQFVGADLGIACPPRVLDEELLLRLDVA